jgi:hypothetical protein
VIDCDHDEPGVGEVLTEAVPRMAVDVEVPVVLVVCASGETHEYSACVGGPLGQEDPRLLAERLIGSDAGGHVERQRISHLFTP